jgi:hypothetical protein
MPILLIELSNRDDNQIPGVVLMQAHSFEHSELHGLVPFLYKLLAVLLQKRDAPLKVSYIITHVDHEV